ncbi:MAG: cell envelope integrity protein TolA [Thainema sp.]
MSEYQYYEFLAVDRPLTSQEQAVIQKLSSRVQISSSRAVFVYNYSDFPGDAEQILAKYFDIMFYIANWGSWQFMFRLPSAIADLEWFEPYCLTHAITCTQTKQHIVLNIEISDDGWSGWAEGDGWLSQIAPLRDDLLKGDLRLLYLAWLRVIDQFAGYELEDDPVEPPVPPNLGQLSAPLKAFMELVELDPDLVATAAQASPKQKSGAESPLENWLPELSEAERQEFLIKLIRQEPRVDLQLIRRLKELAGADQAAPQVAAGTRRLSELCAIADELRDKRLKKERAAAEKKRQKEQEAARKKRLKYLENFAPKADQAWDQIVELLQRKQAKPYDEATQLLHDLRDVAEQQGKLPEFRDRFERLKSNYENRPALMKRFETIKV